MGGGVERGRARPGVAGSPAGVPGAALPLDRVSLALGVLGGGAYGLMRGASADHLRAELLRRARADAATATRAAGVQGAAGWLIRSQRVEVARPAAADPATMSARATVVDLRGRGYTVAAIADKVGWSASWVAKVCRAAGVPDPAVAVDRAARATVVELRGRGCSLSLIADKVGRSRSWVAKVCRESGAQAPAFTVGRSGRRYPARWPVGRVPAPRTAAPGVDRGDGSA